MEGRTLIYDALMHHIMGGKVTPSRWTAFNGPCCIHNGQMRPDSRKRSGLIFDNDGRTSVSCFNCGFRIGWKPGSYFSSKWERYFQWLGMPAEKIKWLAFRVNELRHTMLKEGVEFSTQLPVPERKYVFNAKTLPVESLPINMLVNENCDDPFFLRALSYLASRGDEILLGNEYFWSPDKNFRERVIIPFYWEDEIVGYTARHTDSTNSYRYMTDVQPGYIFNTEKVKEDWEYLFVVEGPFDAIAINGVAMLGDKVTSEQASWINKTGKKVIVVPDRVNQGGRLVDVALREGWSVSFPTWDKGVKDAADATKAYGKLYTVWSIIDSRAENRLEIGVKRQRLQ